MPITPTFGIPYPDGNSAYTPLQDWFAGIATGTENALNTGLGGAPRLANSDSERTTIFPTPVQGNTVLRPDKGYTEQYYGLYNAGTNPGGATPAGWYPVSGAMPHGVIKQGANSVQSIPTATFTQITNYTLTDGGILRHVTASSGTLSIGISGYYKVHGAVSFAFNATGVRLSQITKNSTLSTSGVIAYSPTYIGSSVANNVAEANTVVPLAAGDVIRLWGWQSSGGALNTTSSTTDPYSPTSAYLEAQYVSPPSGY